MRRLIRFTAAGLVGLAGPGCLHDRSPTDLIGEVWPKPSGGSGQPAATQSNAPPVAVADPTETESGELCLEMARELDTAGQEADAILYYERARSLDPDLSDRAARRLAVLYDRADEQARAMTEFQTALERNPKDAGLLNDFGYSLYNRGQWAEAETYLRRAVEADPENLRAWVNLGMALAQQDRGREAVEAFGKAVTPAEAEANLGFILATRGRRADARAAYQRALAIEPTLKGARAAIAKLDGRSDPTGNDNGLVLPASQEEPGFTPAAW